MSCLTEKHLKRERNKISVQMKILFQKFSFFVNDVDEKQKVVWIKIELKNYFN